jgi:hypothetical protein
MIHIFSNIRPSFQALYQALYRNCIEEARHVPMRRVAVALGMHVMLQDLMRLDLLSLHSSELRIHRPLNPG